jgi:hypothetical protein
MTRDYFRSYAMRSVPWHMTSIPAFGRESSGQGTPSDPSSAGLLVPDLTVHERHEDLRHVNLTGPNFKFLHVGRRSVPCQFRKSGGGDKMGYGPRTERQIRRFPPRQQGMKSLAVPSCVSRGVGDPAAEKDDT